MDRRKTLGLLGAGLAMASTRAFGQTAPELRADASRAWFYVLPLIEMAAARTRMMDVSRPGQHAGLNAFAHAQHLATPSDHAITTPNNDTLYSSAFIDLTDGPVTLTVPDPGARYLSVAVMDLYTNNNIVIGAHTPGGPAGVYRLVGPGHPLEHKNDLRVETPHAWVLSRVLVDGEVDMAAAHAVQSRVLLSGPAAPRPKAYARRDADWSAYFASAAELLKSDPPKFLAGQDAFDRLRAAGKDGGFSRAGYGAGDLAAIDAGVAQARALIRGAGGFVRFTDGWSYPPADLGQFGDDFMVRAVVAVAGLGALPRDEAMYMRAQSEDGSAIFHGDGLYRFSLTKPVPVDAFWSLTLYEATSDGQFFLTENPINRYAIGDRTPGLTKGPDGSIDLWIGRADPGDGRRANWLPAPAKGPFAMTLRAYLPKAELKSGAYRLPRVVKA